MKTHFALLLFASTALASPKPGEDFETTTGIHLAWMEPLGIRVGTHEITWKQYSDTAGPERLAERNAGLSEEKTLSRLEFQYPQPVWLSWEQATEFCAKLTEQERAAGDIGTDYQYSLPSSQEWDQFVGDAADVLASPEEWARTLVNDEASLMGKPNQFGLYNLIGGRAEWCSDPGDTELSRVNRGHSSCQLTTAEMFSAAKARGFAGWGRPDIVSGSYGMRIVLRKTQ